MLCDDGLGVASEKCITVRSNSTGSDTEIQAEANADFTSRLASLGDTISANLVTARLPS